MAALEREAFGFADYCADPAHDAAAVITEFHRIIALAGFTCAVAAAVAGVAANAPVRFYFNSLPDDWMRLIAERDLLRKGLAGNIEVYRRMAPFEALSTARARRLTALEREAIAAQHEFGWRTIFAVPLHGPAGYRGAVMALSKEAIALPPRLRMAIRLSALAVHDVCHASQTLGTFAPDPGLTLRELECVQGVAGGLSDKQIARRVGISAHTVKTHIDSARIKMKVRSRSAAAAFIVLLGKD